MTEEKKYPMIYVDYDGDNRANWYRCDTEELVYDEDVSCMYNELRNDYLANLKILNIYEGKGGQ